MGSLVLVEMERGTTQGRREPSKECANLSSKVRKQRREDEREKS